MHAALGQEYIYSGCDPEFCFAALRKEEEKKKKKNFQHKADFLRSYVRDFADFQVIFIKIPKFLIQGHSLTTLTHFESKVRNAFCTGGRGKVMSRGANKLHRPFLPIAIYSRDPRSKMPINSCENKINSC
jgi:hypothetical protein